MAKDPQINNYLNLFDNKNEEENKTTPAYSYIELDFGGRKSIIEKEK